MAKATESCELAANNMNATTVKIKINLEFDPKYPYILKLDGPRGFVDGVCGSIYFDEHDGTTMGELAEGINCALPCQVKVSSNGKNEAWLDSEGTYNMEILEGATIEMDYTQEYDGKDYLVSKFNNVRLVPEGAGKY